MTLTDELASIIQRAQRLDESAFDWIVNEYSARLYGFLCRLTGRRADAEDLVQEVFVRVVRKIARYEHDGRFDAWLFRIATNLARDRIRRITRTPELRSLDRTENTDDGSGFDVAARGTGQDVEPAYRMELAEDVDRLQNALERLPQAEREVITMRHYGQMSFAEIAGVMETPLGTALARAHRGLAKLRTWMESE